MGDTHALGREQPKGVSRVVLLLVIAVVVIAMMLTFAWQKPRGIGTSSTLSGHSAGRIAGSKAKAHDQVSRGAPEPASDPRSSHLSSG